MSDLNFKSEFIKCECWGEGMGIDFDPDDGLYYFSYWSNCITNGRLSWRQKLRYCWQVLVKGTPFNDQLIFDQKSVDQLTHFLSKNRMNRPGYPVGDTDFGTSME